MRLGLALAFGLLLGHVFFPEKWGETYGKVAVGFCSVAPVTFCR